MTREELAKSPTKEEVSSAYMKLTAAGVESIGDRRLRVLADILVDAFTFDRDPIYSGAEQWLACSLVVTAARVIEEGK